MSDEPRASTQSGQSHDGTQSGEEGNARESDEHGAGPESGEHGNTDGSSDEGEESGTQYRLNEDFDEVRAGARLIVSYDATANAFTGTVQNTTAETLTRVRVEVHLSNGIELGPTTPIDLAPDQVADINLPASVRPFTSWSAHPEVG